MHSFHNTLDLAAINDWILYKELAKENIARSHFISKLAEGLAEPSVHNRNHIPAQGSHTEDETHLKKFCQAKVSCKRNRSVGERTQRNKSVCGTCTDNIQRVCKKCNDATD